MLKINRKMMGLVILCIVMLAVIFVVGRTSQQDAGGEQEGEVKKEALPGDTAAQFPVTIIDATGEEVIIENPIERIVVLNTNAAEIVRALGAADRVVGVHMRLTERLRFYPEMSKLPTVGKWREPDIEAILALNPDIVLAFENWPAPEKLEEKLQGTGVTVVRLNFFKASTLREEVIALGKILGAETEANNYVAWHDAVVNPIKEKVAAMSEKERARVFIEGRMGGGKEFGRRAWGPGTGMHDLVVAAGGINIVEGYVEGFADVEVEWILKENPDVIIARSFKGGYETDDHTEVKAYYEILQEVPGFAKLKAVQENRVYIITGAIASGPQYPAGLAAVARWLYPDKFADLDPQAIHQEYIDMFCPGLDFDVRRQGVFAYPPFQQ